MSRQQPAARDTAAGTPDHTVLLGGGAAERATEFTSEGKWRDGFPDAPEYAAAILKRPAADAAAVADRLKRPAADAAAVADRLGLAPADLAPADPAPADPAPLGLARPLGAGPTRARVWG